MQGFGGNQNQCSQGSGGRYVVGKSVSTRVQIINGQRKVTTKTSIKYSDGSTEVKTEVTN